MSANDVLRLLRNSRIVEQAISEFETDIVSTIRFGSERADDYYGAGAVGHPPYFTRTERPRFIRSYYQLWGLTIMATPAEWQPRLESMTLKQLSRLYGMSMFPEGTVSIRLDGVRKGRQRDAMPLPPHLEAGLDMDLILNDEPFDWRVALKGEVRKHLADAYQRTHGQDLGLMWAGTQQGGSGDFTGMWDHRQPFLKKIFRGRYSKGPPYRKVLHLELWDSSGEE
ncbi:MAG: hypothetical protein LQ346_006809 [Caloplaca aetnensis]|nr:MAG: hypothetical protein LQ346_006809 [Caloplaca aetnensis]